MFVCLCIPLSTQSLEEKFRDVSTFDQFLKAIEFENKCGACLEELRKRYTNSSKFSKALKKKLK
jgi:bacterioferritin-associated ferredoxin